MTVMCLSGKERVQMTKNSNLPSKAALDRMQRKAEIKAINSSTFKTYCEGLQTITPLIKWVVGGVVTILLLLL